MESLEMRAWEFLHNPGLIREIEDDLTEFGVIGEKEAKLITYLVVISRYLIPSQFIRPRH
jgi:hypothetical protein